MENIIAWFFRVTSIRLILVMSIVYLVFPLYLLPNIINSGAVGPLDLLFWYNHETLYQMVSGYSDTIRVRYLVGLTTVDVAYPIYYGTSLALIIALILKKLYLPFSRKIIFIPYIAVLFDLTENSLIVFLLNAYPEKYILIADIAGYATATKWSAFGVIATTITYIVLYAIWHRQIATH
jgi:hypothetical protein